MISLFFVDNKGEEWIKEMRSLINEKQKPVAYFWWHQRPVGTETTLTCLRKELDDIGFFPIFARTHNRCYLFTVIDFIVDPVENLDELQQRWKSYYLGEWASKKEIKKKVKEWEEEGKVPKILFLVSSVTEIDCSKEIFEYCGIRAHIFPIRL